MTDTAQRVSAARRVIAGASEAEVAAELGVETELVRRWADLYAEGGEWRLSGRMDPSSFEARDRFLTLIAHEFRTPLAIVGGWVETLQSAELPAETRTAGLDVIARQVAHLERIAADALDAGAVAQGRLRLELAPVAVRRLLRRVVTGLGADGIEVGDGAEVTVRGDADRLERAATSLLGHARRLAAGSPVRVTVAGDGPTAEVMCSVEGRSLGFEEVAPLFEPYDREDTSIGTGLGLFLCRALIVAHGGEMGVRSETSGTAFWLRIPVAGPDAGHQAERTSS